MTMRALTAVAVTAVAMLAVSAGPAAAADTEIATLPSQSSIDALDGHVLWSVHDDTAKAWRLLDYSDGVQLPLAVATSASPFDVDLGHDQKGRLVAVYSRCRAALEENGANFGHRGCDIFRYDFASARETKVRAVSSRLDDYEPTVWHRRIAFLRAYPRRAGVREQMYIRDLSARRARPLRGGRGLASPRDLDLRSRTTAVRWAHEFSEDVRLTFAGRDVRTLLATPGSGAAAQQYATLHPTFADAHTVYWGLTSTTPDWGEVWRRDVRTRRIEHATTRINAPFVLFAQDGDVSYYAVHSDPANRTSPLKLHRLEGLVFERAPKLTLD
jgi:hypothetical protein